MGDKLNKKNSPVRNRTKYSYVRNNPLSLTDPSGFFSISDVTGSFDPVTVAFGFLIKRAFGSKPPPKRCSVVGSVCYGKANSSKMSDMVGDIFDRVTDPYGFGKYRDGFDEGLWGSCKYCLNVNPSGSVGNLGGVGTTRSIIVAATSGSISPRGLQEYFESEANKQLFKHLQSEARRVFKEHRNMTREDTIRNFGASGRIMVAIEVDLFDTFANKVGIDGLARNSWEITVRLMMRRFLPRMPTPRPGAKMFTPKFDFSDWVADCPLKGNPYSGHCGFFSPEGDFFDIHDIVPPVMRPSGSGGQHFP